MKSVSAFLAMAAAMGHGMPEVPKYRGHHNPNRQTWNPENFGQQAAERRLKQRAHLQAKLDNMTIGESSLNKARLEKIWFGDIIK